MHVAYIFTHINISFIKGWRLSSSLCKSFLSLVSQTFPHVSLKSGRAARGWINSF